MQLHCQDFFEGGSGHEACAAGGGVAPNAAVCACCIQTHTANQIDVDNMRGNQEGKLEHQHKGNVLCQTTHRIQRIAEVHGSLLARGGFDRTP